MRLPSLSEIDSRATKLAREAKRQADPQQYLIERVARLELFLERLTANDLMRFRGLR